MTTPLLAAPAPVNDWQALCRRAYLIIFGGFGVFVLWAMFASVDGAAIAPGVVSSENNRKTLQHLEGGIVREILVRDGQQVAANDLLLLLDQTRVDSQSDLYRNQFAIGLAQEARLLAEFGGEPEIKWPDDVLAREQDPAVAPVINDQKRLFASRRAAITRNIGIAESQIEQTRRELEQTQGDARTAKATLEQVNAEYESLLPLYRQKLVPTTRMAPLERERLRLKGVISSGEINDRKLQERLEELNLRRQQVLQDYRQEASTQLLDVRKVLSDVRQQMRLANDQQKRAEIRAPIAGTVQQLRFFTIGGVVKPGDPILDIAPQNDELVIRAHVSPNDIDRITYGDRAEIKFPSLHFWGTKAIYATVRAISRDRIVDDPAREGYYATELVVDKETLPNEIRTRLIAGIEAQTLIITGERSVASYLLKPLFVRVGQAMRER